MRSLRLNRSLIAGVSVAAVATTLAGALVGSRSAAEATPDHPRVYAEHQGNPASADRPAATRPVEDVTLPTGDRVRLSRLPGGQQQVTPLPAHRDTGSTSFTQFTVGHDLYVLPVRALPFLDGPLDIGMFDVSYLVRAGLSDRATGTLPLVATLTPGTGAPSVPGLHVTDATGDDRSATLDKSQAWRIGRALTNGAAVPGSAAGPLSGLRRLALAPADNGVRPPPTAHRGALASHGRGLVRRRLTVHAVDRSGHPAMAVLFVQNVDDARRYFSVSIIHGTSTVSVPQGHYLVAANVIRLHPGGSGYDSAFVARPELTVGHHGRSVTLDSRTAQPITASVDGEPTATGLVAISFSRRSAHGGTFYFGSKTSGALGGIGTDTSPLFAAPTRPVRTGGFAFQAYLITSPGQVFDLTGSHYLLDFPNDSRVPDSLSFDVPASALTQVDSRYHWPQAAAPGNCQMAQGFTVAEPWSAYGNGYFIFLSGATARTDYLYSPQASTWFEVVQTPSCEFFLDSWRHLHPGRITDEWFKAPLTPTVQREQIDLDVERGLDFAPAGSLALHTYGCPACRQDNNMVLRIVPWGDSTPGHFVTQEADQQDVSSTTRLYQDGALAMTSILPYAYYPMLPRKATYRLDWQFRKDRPDWPLSTQVDTSWTFHSDPARPGRRPPAFEDCLPDPGAACSLLPLLFVSYDLPLRLDNTAVAPGDLPVTVLVSRQEHLPAPRGLTATLQVSYDDGRTWSAATPLHATGDGRFSTTISQPDPADTSGFVSLRLHAADTDGNAIDQTVLRAYRLATR